MGGSARLQLGWSAGDSILVVIGKMFDAFVKMGKYAYSTG